MGNPLQYVPNDAVGEHRILPQIAPRDRLIAALDVPTCAQAQALVRQLGRRVTFYKVGMQLQFAGGLAFCTGLLNAGKSVFLDAKLHDIPRTVETAIANIAAMGVTMVSVHAYPQTMDAAVRGRASAALKLLGVSVLTSMDDADLTRAGYAHGARDLVRRRAAQAQTCGLDGLVCSPRELPVLRKECDDDFLLITPGIRLAGGDRGDQKRIATPTDAIAAGADRIVVGRPIIGAEDRLRVVDDIIEQIAASAG